MQQSQNDRVSREAPDPSATRADWHSQADNRSSRKKPYPLYVGVGLVLVIIVIGAAAAVSKPFRHQLALSIVRQPTPYTQLYFPSPGTLPGKLKAGQKNTFDFTIVNDESRVYSYTYTVTLADSRSHSVVSTQTVTIADGGSMTRSVTVVPKDHKATYVITVVLKGINQSIHFYSETT